MLLHTTEHSSRRCGYENLIKTCLDHTRESCTNNVCYRGDLAVMSVLLLPWPNGNCGEKNYANVGEYFVNEKTVLAGLCPCLFYFHDSRNIFLEKMTHNYLEYTFAEKVIHEYASVEILF